MIAMKRNATLTLLMPLLALGVRATQAETSWYYLSLNDNGELTNETLSHPQISDPISTSFGDGEGWYYYPASDRYIMWFDNGPYSTDQIAEFDLWAFIASRDFSRSMSYDISMGWTTSAWTDSGSPPGPSDMPTLSEESTFLVENSFASGSGIILGEGTIETSQAYRTRNENPAWAFVSVSGRNLMLFRFLNHDTVDLAPDGNPKPASGACCNSTLGQCTVTETGNCPPGFSYLGDGSTCADCQTGTSNWDFGDAPVSYGVLQIHDGARHALVPAIHLGQGVTSDADGRPSEGADEDSLDDGVFFPDVLPVNQPIDVPVIASTFGFVNGWLDLNRDGDWDDPDEQIFADQFVNIGQNVLSFEIPSGAATGDTYARIRFNTTGGLWHSGPAANGEVEDYRVTLGAGGQPAPRLAPVPPTNRLTAAWRQPAQSVDPLGDQLEGWEAEGSWVQGPLVLDDWTHVGSDPVQGFRWWGVFDNWQTPGLPSDLPRAFHVSIWSEREGIGGPDVLLWEAGLEDWVWAYSGVLRNTLNPTGAEAVFEFIAMLPQDQWFLRDDDPEATYWIGFSAIYEQAGPPSHPWAWLTRQSIQLSPAVTVTHFGSWNTGLVGTWPPSVGDAVLRSQPLGLPSLGSWDMAFELVSNQAATGDASQGSSTGILGDLNGDGLVNQADQVILRGLVIDQ